MSDGASGLSLSEMGISTVKKTANAVKKVVDPFAKQAASQITGQQSTTPTPGHQTAQPPSEIAPKQAGGFDLGKMFDEKNPFGSVMQNKQSSQQSQQLQQQIQQKAAQQKAEDAQKIEQLRKQLHQMYYEDFTKKAEGKDQKKEEPVAEKLEREEHEAKQQEMKKDEEKKKKEEVPLAFRKRSTGELGRAKG